LTGPVDDFHFDAVRGIGKAHNLVAAPVEALDACAVEGHRLMQGPTRRLQYAALNLALDFTLSQEERSAYPGGCRKQHEFDGASFAAPDKSAFRLELNGKPGSGFQHVV
jgi:hypothetical protein